MGLNDPTILKVEQMIKECGDLEANSSGTITPVDEKSRIAATGGFAPVRPTGLRVNI